MVQCPEQSAVNQVRPHEGFLEGAIDSDGYYVQLPEQILRPRPVQSIHMDGMIMHGVRKGAGVEIENNTYVANGEPIHLQFNLPGAYTIKIKQWPYMDWSIDIDNQTRQLS